MWTGAGGTGIAREMDGQPAERPLGADAQASGRIPDPWEKGGIPTLKEVVSRRRCGGYYWAARNLS